LEHRVDDAGDLGVVDRVQRVAADHVHVALVELAEAAALGALAAPHLLDLVAAERERQLVGVLGDVAGQRHRQVEVQTHVRLGAALLWLADRVDLPLHAALGGQHVEPFHRRRLDRREAVELELLPDDAQAALLRQAKVRQPLREARDGFDLHPLAHRRVLPAGSLMVGSALALVKEWTGATTAGFTRLEKQRAPHAYSTRGSWAPVLVSRLRSAPTPAARGPGSPKPG